MTVTVTDLSAYVGDARGHSAAFVEACLDQAVVLVDTYVAGAPVPAGVLDRAYLEVGSELFHRKNAPSGIQAQYSDTMAVAPRLARDPMTGTYPLLARYVGGGFA